MVWAGEKGKGWEREQEVDLERSEHRDRVWYLS